MSKSEEEFNELKYLQLLDKYHQLKCLFKINKIRFQKYKFKLISNLVFELFKYKNSTESYINISNLIVMFLTAFDKHYSIDLYTELKNNDLNRHDNQFRNILKSEFEISL